MVLLSGLQNLRHDRRLLRIPPYLSALCIIIGVAWLLLLPLDEYSRHTYVSENAILPGQVHAYFGGSEHDVFRAYRYEVHNLAQQQDDNSRVQSLVDILKTNGLKTGVQEYSYELSGQRREGKNVYAVLQGPRADATEAMVLIAAWRNMDDVVNYSGVALALTLARYFKRWSIWSKDIIVLIPSDSTFGPQAWVDAYHDTHDPSTVSSLTIKAGAIQAAVALDYPAGPWGHRFDKIHVVYDGVNGQLPNLDLLNTAVNIASGQMGIGCTIQRMFSRGDSYQDRLETVLRGMLSQALGHATGPHSSFMPYHIDAITLQTVGDGWHDEMSLGRAVEGLFRSINNLLEHLHQSFFFYLLMHSRRFVSIGTYLPSAMLVAVNFTITAILLWVQSGQPTTPERPLSPASPDVKSPQDMTLIKEGKSIALVPSVAVATIQRQMFMPLTVIFSVHALGLIPFYALNQVADTNLSPTVICLVVSAIASPALIALVLRKTLHPSPQDVQLIQCFSLLLLGAALSTLATVNFSQALFVGLMASPLSFVRAFAPRKTLPLPLKAALGVLAVAVMIAVSPPATLHIWSLLTDRAHGELLAASAWAWKAENVWTPVTVWLIWWPAWALGGVALCSGFF